MDGLPKAVGEDEYVDPSDMFLVVSLHAAGVTCHLQSKDVGALDLQ
jgi:hypothetical protein